MAGLKLTDVVLNEDGTVKRNEDGSPVMLDRSTGASRFATTALNQAAAGFGDEILDAVGAEEAARVTRRNQDRLEAESTGGAIAAGALGFLVPGGALAKAAGLGAKGLRAGQRIARGAGVGATEGAVISAGNADGEGESRATAALTGAALGGVIGGAIPGLGALFRRTPTGAVEGVSDDAVQRAANSLNTTPDDLIKGLSDGDSIEAIALRANGGDERAAQDAVRALTDLTPELQRTIGRNAEDSLEGVGQRVSDTATQVDDSLARATRSTLDDVDVDAAARALTDRRTEIGRQLGEVRAASDVNVEGVLEELITNPESSRILRAQLQKVVEETGNLRTSSQITSEAGDTIGEFKVLSRAEAEKEGLSGAGIYAEITRDGKKVFEPAQMDSNVFSTLAQRLRQAGSDQLDNSAENASSTTALGEALVNASEAVTAAVGRAVPETSTLNNQFIRTDAQQRVSNLVGRMLNSSNAQNKASLGQRLNQIIDGENTVIGKSEAQRNIEPDEIVQSVRVALREQIDAGKLKTFDESSTEYKTIQRLMQRADAEDEFDSIVQSVNNQLSTDDLRGAIQKGLDNSTDPKAVGNALRQVFKTPSMRASLDALPKQEADAYLAAIDDAIKEMNLLEKFTKGSNTRLLDPPSFLEGLASHLPFTAVVFNSYAKAGAVASLRAGRDSGAFRSFAKDNKVNSQISRLLQTSPELVEEGLQRTLRESIETGNTKDIVRRSLIDTARRASVAESVDDDPAVVENIVNEYLEPTGQLEDNPVQGEQDNGSLIEAINQNYQLDDTQSLENF